MLKSYPFSNIWINGRLVSIDKVVHKEVAGQSPFEDSTFEFIRLWLSGEETFTQSTSGSTGEPRQIPISRRQMIASTMKTAERLTLQKLSSSLTCIDTRYIGGKMMLARSLTLGLQMVAVDPVANPLIRIPVDKCVQFTALVPYQISAVLESKHPHLLNNFERVLIGGAPLNEKLSEQLNRFQCLCYETYGMTETVSHVALRLVNTRASRPYFEVVPGVEVEQDDRGCLLIRADHLAAPVVTNDLVELVAPGCFIWLGRWDNVINTGGVKVMPEKIEQSIARVFRENDLTTRFFIAGWPDEKLGNKIVLILEGVQFSAESLGASLANLKSAVSPFEFPKEVYSVPAFIMTDTQKIDRRQTLAGVAPLPISLI